jgi:hypothetical protein
MCQSVHRNGQGLLIATQKRLIFVHKRVVRGLKVGGVSLDEVSSFQYEAGIALGTITTGASGNKETIKNIKEGAARAFGEGVIAHLSARSRDTERTRDGLGLH